MKDLLQAQRVVGIVRSVGGLRTNSEQECPVNAAFQAAGSLVAPHLPHKPANKNIHLCTDSFNAI